MKLQTWSLGWVLLLVLAVGILVSTLPARAEVVVTVNGSRVDFPGVDPVMVEDVPLIPLEPVLAATNRSYTEFFSQGNLIKPFQHIQGSMRVIGPEGKAQMEIGADFATLNGIPYWLEEPAALAGGTILVPPRFLALVTGLDFVWDANARTLTLRPEPGFTFRPGISMTVD